MAGFADIALSSAPIFGGALLGLAAGQFKGPDFRAGITADLDLIDRLPPEQVDRRAALQRSVDQRIDDLLTANDRSRALRSAAGSYQGNWRDIVLFICAVLFAIIWWHVPHGRANWTVFFVVLIAVCVITALYAFRGVRRALGRALTRNSSRS